MEQRLMSINDAAIYLGVKPATLRMRLWRGQIPKEAIIRLGRKPRRVYLDKLILDMWIDMLRGEN